MTRGATVFGVLVLASLAGEACFSSSPGPEVPDGSTGVGADSPGDDASSPSSPEAGGDAAPDATLEATTPDATVTEPEAGSDAGPVEAGPVEASGEGGFEGGAEASLDAAVDAGPGTVTSVSGLLLRTTRQNHTATLLANGHVLICGGWYGPSGSSASCDDFDPATTTISAGPSMIYGRRNHTATLLPGGKVLVAGGSGTSDAGTFTVLPTAEIYDPGSNSFALVSHPMAEARGAAAVLMTAGPNAGKVVLVGGYGDGTVDGSTPSDPALDSAEVFDPGSNPVSGTFTLLAAHMSARRAYLTAAGLAEGGLLAAGGSFGPGGGPYVYLTTGETLDPALTAFTDAASAMSSGRQSTQSVVLPDGRVFVFDGVGPSGSIDHADIYDPATRTFSSSASLPMPRDYVALALLASGRVLIAGGVTPGGTVGDVVVYDPPSNTFATATGTLNPPRALATATTLTDGRVLIAGGQTAQGYVSTAVDVFKE